jgi:penicillin amidase
MAPPVLTRKSITAAAALLLGCQSPDPQWHALSSDVTVRRDEWGVAHISTKDADDSLYGLGYETARDRLFQLDWLRRRTLGTTAELLGDAHLTDDRIARTLGFGPLGVDAEADLLKNDPAVHRMLSAYAAGINAYIADAAAGRNGATWPPEYADIDPAYRPDPWLVADTLAMLKAQIFSLAAHPETDLLYYAMTTGTDGPTIARELFNPIPLETVYVTPGFPQGPTASRSTQPGRRLRSPSRAPLELAAAFAHFSGRHRIGPVGASNNMAVCPRQTASGGTLLENDPHLDIDLPTNLYEFQLDTDTVKVAGFGIPGLPAVLAGHNADIAWGVTTVEADDADTYLEVVNGDAVTFNGMSVAMNVREETLRSRQPDGTFTEQTLKVRVVPHHGPVISDAVDDVKLLLGDHKALSIKWPGFGVTHEPRAYYDLFRAKSYADFKSALNHFECGLLNFVYAGADGDIGYYPHSIYPLRAQLDPQNPPYGVLPGNGKYEWTGQIPDDRIPQLHNPDSCQIFSANNDPVGTTADGNVLNDAFYLGGTFDYGLRAKRISDRIGAVKTLDDLQAVQNDVHDGVAEHFVPPLAKAAVAHPPSPAAAALLAQLNAWDREDAADEVAPTIFNAWYSQLIADVFADDLGVSFSTAGGDDRYFTNVLQRLVNGQTTSHDYLNGGTLDDALLKALEEVAAKAPADLTQWKWGTVHTNTFNHPLGGRYNLGPVALSGGLSTVSCARYSPLVDGQPTVGGDVGEAPNLRMVVELTKTAVTMRAVLPTGQSGVVGNPHYDDQLPLWSQNKTRDCWFTPEDVAAHAMTTTTLKQGTP